MSGLLFAFLATTGLGVHAYYHHRREGHKAISARRWMYGLYSAAFLLVAIADYSLLLMTVLLGYQLAASYHMVYFTIVLLASYSVVLAGTRRKPY